MLPVETNPPIAAKEVHLSRANDAGEDHFSPQKGAYLLRNCSSFVRMNISQNTIDREVTGRGAFADRFMSTRVVSPGAALPK
jgi:hypothetical protein